MGKETSKLEGTTNESSGWYTESMEVSYVQPFDHWLRGLLAASYQISRKI
jgi:hypothetical protein